MKNGFSKRSSVRRQSTLYRWIILGCITLTIPIICAVINFFINKNLIERKINQVNDFVLQNIKYNIDTHMDDILQTAHYYLMNPDYSLYAFSTKDEDLFNSRMHDCYKSMRLFQCANPDIEVMIYLKDRDYLITSSTANQLSYIHNTMISRGRISVNMDTLRQQLTVEQKGFRISDTMSYKKYGKENLVYAMPLLESDLQNCGYLIVSIPTKFIAQLMKSEANLGNSILILDENDRVLGQYGEKLKLDKDKFETKIKTKQKKDRLLFEVGGEKYVGASTTSDITGWKYIACMPEKVLMSEVTRNRNINLLVVLIGTVIGVAAVIVLQRRNYRPVRQLMEILPKRGEDQDDEFVTVEKSLRNLYRENQTMQDSMEKRFEYDRELALLSIMKGKTSFFRKLGEEELLGAGYREKHFAFVTIGMQNTDSGPASEITTDQEMLSFVIDNITKELFDNKFQYLKTQDDILLVLLFFIDSGQEEKWKEISMEKFRWLNEFFQKRLESDLTVTIGEIFDTFDYVESAYAEITEANEQRYYTQPDGVIRAETVEKVDVTSVGRLEYYGKKFGEVARTADMIRGKEISLGLFEEVKNSGKGFNANLYYVLAIVNHVLMLSQDLIRNREIQEDAVWAVLRKMRTSETLCGLQNGFSDFLRLICRAVDQDNKESGTLSSSIREFVKERYSDSNVNISAIADEMKITPRYMSRIFKEQTGVNLLDYINDVRIEHAKKFLSTTDMTVEEITEKVGFTNSRTFRRNFRKAAGMTAADYKIMTDKM